MVVEFIMVGFVNYGLKGKGVRMLTYRVMMKRTVIMVGHSWILLFVSMILEQNKIRVIDKAILL